MSKRRFSKLHLLNLTTTLSISPVDYTLSLARQHRMDKLSITASHQNGISPVSADNAVYTLIHTILSGLGDRQTYLHQAIVQSLSEADVEMPRDQISLGIEEFLSPATLGRRLSINFRTLQSNYGRFRAYFDDRGAFSSGSLELAYSYLAFLSSSGCLVRLYVYVKLILGCRCCLRTS